MLKNILYILISLTSICSCSFETAQDSNVKSQQEELKQKWIISKLDKTILESDTIGLDTNGIYVNLPMDLDWLDLTNLEEYFSHYSLVTNFGGYCPHISSIYKSSTDTVYSGSERKIIEWNFNHSNKNLTRIVKKEGDTISYSKYLLDSIYFEPENLPQTLTIIRSKEMTRTLWNNTTTGDFEKERKLYDSLKDNDDYEFEIKHYEWLLQKKCKGTRIGTWKQATINYDSTRYIEWDNGIKINDNTLKTKK